VRAPEPEWSATDLRRSRTHQATGLRGRILRCWSGNVWMDRVEWEMAYIAMHYTGEVFSPLLTSGVRLRAAGAGTWAAYCARRLAACAAPTNCRAGHATQWSKRSLRAEVTAYCARRLASCAARTNCRAGHAAQRSKRPLGHKRTNVLGARATWQGAGVVPCGAVFVPIIAHFLHHSTPVTRQAGQGVPVPVASGRALLY
jgi:hypothetical protein